MLDTYPRIPAAVTDNVSELIRDYSARNYYFGQIIGARNLDFDEGN